MLKLILGPAGSGKTSMITNEIKRKASSGEGGMIIIVPEQYSFEAERELCSVCGDSLSLYAEVLSFSRLAVRVSQETGTGGRTAIDKGGRLLCMSLALNEVGSRLGVFKAARYKPEFQAALLQTVSELKASCISSETLCRAAESCGKAMSEKLRDLALCLEAYEAVLEQGHADPTDKILYLAETIGESSIGKKGSVYVDGFVDFTGAEMLVLESIIKNGADITVCLTCDDLYGDSEHFAPSRAAANKLLRIAYRCGIAAEIVHAEMAPEKARPLLFFAENLFGFALGKSANENNCISLFKTDSIRAECELAAARCTDLVRETGCRFRDIAVAVRGFDSYSAVLEETFKFYGVPLFTARRTSILQKPIPALISSAFEIIHGGWDLEDVLSYMKTGLIGISQNDRDILENYAVLWNVRGFLWTRDKPWTMHPKGFGFDFDESSRKLLDKVDSLRRTLAAPLAALSAKGEKAQTAAEQAKALAEFLVEIDLPETLSKKALELEKSGRSLLAAEYSQLWEIVVKSLEQTSAILGETSMTQEQFAKLFLLTLSQYDVSAIPVSLDSVSAGDMDRMRRRHIKHLIILGASDDRLPCSGSDTGLFSLDERDELNELGIPLGGGTDELAREFCLIYNCVALPSETLTISYSSFDENGAQVRPSFLAARAKLLFGLEEKTFDLLSARLRSRSPAFLLAASQRNDELSKLAYAYFSESGEEGKLMDLKEKARQSRQDLSPAAVSALYGDTLHLSPSRADAFSACQFFYFLRYGLKLSEREQAGFEAPELGTFMHYVLENVANEIGESVGFKNASDELTAELVNKYTNLYVKEKLNDFEDKSPRFIYLFNRLLPSVRNVVSDMVRELSKSDFVPLDFELSFSNGGDLPPVKISGGGNDLFLNGTADRVDGYFYDGKLYLRVIDYKTGKKSFSLTDVWNGMGMQMLLYLFALEMEGKSRYNAEVVPAGVLYVPARDTLISASGDLSEEELSKEKSKALKRSGLILFDASVINAMEKSDNPEYIPVSFKKDGSLTSDSLATSEQFCALRNHVDRRLIELSENIRRGKIDVSPYYKGEQDNACLYCHFKSVCRFDESRDTRRYLSKVTPGEFWERLEGKNEQNQSD